MDRELFEAALAVRQNAYAPYSRFTVGAALRTEAGSVRVGCNVENAAYPQACCAEAAAIAVMVAASASPDDRRIARICVVATAIDGRLAAPCGGCRQRIAEFAAPDAEVYIADPEGMSKMFRVGELLPEAFDLGLRP